MVEDMSVVNPLLDEPGSIAGDIISQYLAVALFALIVYDCAITLDDEVKHYWRAPFSISQALFFINRYFSILSNLLVLITQTLENPSDTFCKHIVPATFILGFSGIAIIQVILITRIWFLFPGGRAVYFGLIFSFLCSFSASIYFLCISLPQLRIIPLAASHKVFGAHASGCRAFRPVDSWKIYVPSLILHTGLYVLTVHQALATQSPKIAGIRKKLLTDGGVFYFIVLCSISLTSIGSFLTKIPQINVPAIFSPIVQTTNSIATSRIMFSLRSIVARDEDSIEWVMSTDGPAMPLPESPSAGMSVFKCKSAKRKWHERSTYMWSTEIMTAPARPTTNWDTDVMVLSKETDTDQRVLSRPSLQSAVDIYSKADGDQPAARYGSLYDEEKGLDEAYKRAMTTGEGFF